MVQVIITQVLFLYGLSQNLDLPNCGRLASAVASAVVGQFGPRLSIAEYQTIKKTHRIIDINQSS